MSRGSGKRGRLSAEDRAYWDLVTRSATPLHEAKLPVSDQDVQTTRPIKPPANPVQNRPAAMRIEPFSFRAPAPPAHSLAPTLEENFASRGINMDRKTHRRMSQGKLSPQARLDLHGMTLGHAHSALNGFIIRAHAERHRLVLVITGKGRASPQDDGPIPVRRGLLRHQVPDWLSSPPLSAVVMQVTPAHRRHGGGGAYYVYLRR